MNRRSSSPPSWSGRAPRSAPATPASLRVRRKDMIVAPDEGFLYELPRRPSRLRPRSEQYRAPRLPPVPTTKRAATLRLVRTRRCDMDYREIPPSERLATLLCRGSGCCATPRWRRPGRPSGCSQTVRGVGVPPGAAFPPASAGRKLASAAGSAAGGPDHRATPPFDRGLRGRGRHPLAARRSPRIPPPPADRAHRPGGVLGGPGSGIRRAAPEARWRHWISGAGRGCWRPGWGKRLKERLWRGRASGRGRAIAAWVRAEICPSASWRADSE